METYFPLNQLIPGQQAVIRTLLSTGSMRRRLLDIGFVEDTRIQCVGQSPLGDPAAYFIRGTLIAIRAEDGKEILVSAAQEEADDGLH